jgi:hypothetical protein
MLATMTRRLTGSLRETPVVVPALATIVLFVVWAASQAGYPLTHWAPGALIVLVLLVIALLAVPQSPVEIPLSVRLALACLAAYTALSFLSILWASVPGEAWEGANRTLLYLMVFALFSLWRGRGASAALLLSFWTLALVGLAVYVAVRLDTVTAGGIGALFAGERLSYPVGYPNAAAAQWLMAFWPALMLARGPRIQWFLRGLFAGGAVLLADLALLSQSRGSLYATPVMIVLVFAFVPNRLRTFAAAVPVALGIGLSAPFVLRVGERLSSGQSPSAAVHSAVAAMFVATLLVGVLVGAAAAAESTRAVSPTLAKRARRAVAALATIVLLLVLAGGLVAVGNPLTRVRHSWESFEGGYSADATSGNRLLSGLGSNRYDFYRVALDEFENHPVVGIGADNFQQQYLELGHSNETPRYPHSVELRTLSQTGLLGVLFAIVGLIAALVAGRRAMRSADPLSRDVAAAALGGFAYWAVHGSFDWFWEFAGLGAPAFALLGLACSLAPAPKRAGAPEPVRSGDAVDGPAARLEHRRRLGRMCMWAVTGALVLIAAASLAAPWLSERQLQSAARIWPKQPLAAYSRLEGAAELNPLSDQPYLVAGSIALRFGDLPRAQRDFSLALGRVPGGAYAMLELGGIASESGHPGRALVLLEQAARSNPRDPLTGGALQAVRSGRRVSLQALNRSILLRAEHLS